MSLVKVFRVVAVGLTQGKAYAKAFALLYGILDKYAQNQWLDWDLDNLPRGFIKESYLPTMNGFLALLTIRMVFRERSKTIH